ncbi:hypothetical protein [Candidatus Viadribacter manganicus]|uniref:Uncharacterized protein n=1 Tax=Candidatus Viadribacter manganicus TaxID=1759059 RepID=A0A1B1AD44_9PROT|nr:hypothetical protein [Candidatus Viadribacter manganicus]ANP44472.1 hypothetical protein ATE48_00310 [Candidatus Viadribacter manganicus]
MNKNRAVWEELRSLLIGVVKEIDATLDTKNRELLTDFIENREFEVALDWVSSIIEERQVALSSEGQHSIAHARRIMQKAD